MGHQIIETEDDIQMHLALPLLGVDNGNAVSESSGDNSSTDLCSRHLEEYWAHR
jgi:hypothetical protein